MWTRLKTWKRRLGLSADDDDLVLVDDPEYGKEDLIHILFVCMGNICRSPMAEGMFRKVQAEDASGLSLFIDSAGTHSYHVGASPDERAQLAASRRGIDISRLTARKVEIDDYERFDYILAMDRLNLECLLDEASAEYHEKIHLLLDFSRQNKGSDVPDPYYGAAVGFERVLDLVAEAAAELLTELQQRAKETDR